MDSSAPPSLGGILARAIGPRRITVTVSRISTSLTKWYISVLRITQRNREQRRDVCLIQLAGSRSSEKTTIAVTAPLGHQDFPVEVVDGSEVCRHPSVGLFRLLPPTPTLVSPFARRMTASGVPQLHRARPARYSSAHRATIRTPGLHGHLEDTMARSAWHFRGTFTG